MDNHIKSQRIGILMGGCSSEREISLKSGQAIFTALANEGCSVTCLDVQISDETELRRFVAEAGIDLAFIALHGGIGEDGTIQKILAECGIPFTGSGWQASRLAMDKVETQNLLKKNNISVPQYVNLTKGEADPHVKIEQEIGGYPVCVKPARQGSSIGMSVARSRDELAPALALAWQYDTQALVDRYIQGREMTVGVLDETPMPVVEIKPKNKYFDFQAKYTQGMTEYVVPAEISDALKNELQSTALAVHQLAGCQDLSRVDFIVAEDGRPFVLEINTVPGFTATSLLPKAAAQNGLTFNKLCLQLVERAYGKKKEKRNTDTSGRH